MRNSETTLKLTGFADIFNSSELNTIGQVVQLPISELFPPEFHPFYVSDDEAMERLVRSIKKYGVREPGLVRTIKDGCYELIAGNRRRRACELAGLSEMPVIIREMDDDNAAIAMVDSNLEHRERILPSEKAWAYHVKMEALNHQGIKSDKKTYEILVEQTGESKNQIFRIIRLTELISELANMVDNKKLAFNPAVELSYLSYKEQVAVAECMQANQIKPSLSQAARLKKAKQNGTLTDEYIETVLSEIKKQPRESENFKYGRYFPADFTAEQMEAVIVKLLVGWREKIPA